MTTIRVQLSSRAWNRILRGQTLIGSRHRTLCINTSGVSALPRHSRLIPLMTSLLRPITIVVTDNFYVGHGDPMQVTCTWPCLNGLFEKPAQRHRRQFLVKCTEPRARVCRFSGSDHCSSATALQLTSHCGVVDIGMGI